MSSPTWTVLESTVWARKQTYLWQWMWTNILFCKRMGAEVMGWLKRSCSLDLVFYTRCTGVMSLSKFIDLYTLWTENDTSKGNLKIPNPSKRKEIRGWCELPLPIESMTMLITPQLSSLFTHTDCNSPSNVWLTQTEVVLQFNAIYIGNQISTGCNVLIWTKNLLRFTLPSSLTKGSHMACPFVIHGWQINRDACNASVT